MDYLWTRKDGNVYRIVGLQNNDLFAFQLSATILGIQAKRIINELKNGQDHSDFKKNAIRYFSVPLSDVISIQFELHRSLMRVTYQDSSDFEISQKVQIDKQILTDVTKRIIESIGQPVNVTTESASLWSSISSPLFVLAFVLLFSWFWIDAAQQVANNRPFPAGVQIRLLYLVLAEVSRIVGPSAVPWICLISFAFGGGFVVYRSFVRPQTVKLDMTIQ